MYYISNNKVYAKLPNGFREVKISKDEEGNITIENLKDTVTIEVEEVCIIDEVIARYQAIDEEKPKKDDSDKGKETKKSKK